MAGALSPVESFAPQGRLRASINLGNPILAHRNLQTGEAAGVSVDLAEALARRLGVPLELVVVETASKSVDAVRQGQADIGSFAIDPLRGEGMAFSAPYVLIEGSYLVPEHSSLQRNEEVDRPGTRVTVGQGSAYDLFLSRELRHAQIVRAPSSQAVVETFVQQGLEVAAGVRQQLQSDMQRFAGYRLLPGRFMVIQQAMGIASDRGLDAAIGLGQFVEEMKSGGFVAEALARHGVRGASVAPAAIAAA